ncbi:MAG: hypothetical protein CSA11_11365 [Chloroflexi bacterium]|nr:MAG: hypothetical protein CSA11_11365 [Chloroflexota bacterium]
MIGTPFHNRTQAICEALNWRNWAGYASAGKYELSHDREYYAIRNAAALIDVSPLYKYLVQEPDAEKFVNRLITRDASKCKIGQVLYTTWCDDQGKVIDDGTVSRLDHTTFRLTAAEPNLRWFTDTAFGMEISIIDMSEQLAALALQEPHARNILLELVAETEQLSQLKYFYLMPATINGRSLSISRTGYTGDLGYELWLPPADTEAIWDALLEAGAGYEITLTGILALDIATILPQYAAIGTEILIQMTAEHVPLQVAAKNHSSTPNGKKHELKIRCHHHWHLFRAAFTGHSLHFTPSLHGRDRWRLPCLGLCQKWHRSSARSHRQLRPRSRGRNPHQRPRR